MISDYKKKGRKEKDNAKRTRSLVALGLNILTDSSIEDACSAVTDGFGDNGIDGIYYAEHEKCLYILQSKFHKDGTGSIKSGDIHKFLKGTDDLIRANFRNFNNRVKKRKSELVDQLLDAQNKINLVIIHSGKDRLSTHCSDALNQFLEKQNEISEQFYLHTLNIKDIYSFISSGLSHKQINVEVALHNWGFIKEPLRAIYGQIAGSDLAAWYEQAGRHLFAPNIRMFLGNTDVNLGISETLKTKPEYFWYFNNGVTVLCNQVSKKAIGGDSRETGLFECRDIKIVNGAQTVGTLHSLLRNQSHSLASSRIWIRLVELPQDNNELSKEITKTNNTQNKIEKRDFVSLDPDQKRIQDELLLNNIAYTYKSGETSDREIESFDIVDATIARACIQNDVQYAVQAKREISKLWDDIDKPPYRILFNSKVKGPDLYKEVQVLRKVESFVTKQKKKLVDRDKLLVSHGNRFILHLVYLQFRRAIYKDTFKLEQVEGVCENLFRLLIDAIDELQPNAYLATLFKNKTKCSEIKMNIENAFSNNK